MDVRPMQPILDKIDPSARSAMSIFNTNSDATQKKFSNKRSFNGEDNDAFLEYPRFDPAGRHPFDYKTLRFYQEHDAKTQQLLTNTSDFLRMNLGGEDLVCRRNGRDFQIVLTDLMLPRMIAWYHKVSSHTEGPERLLFTISRHFYHPRLRTEVYKACNACELCQRTKRTMRQYSELTPREATAIPWQEVHIDCIGPWQVKVKGRVVKFVALTAIDPVTNLVDIARLNRKTASECFRAFERCWLSRYPRPFRCLHDGGPEFTGHDFAIQLQNAGIRSKPISAQNPQSNGICERVHQTIGQILRTYVQLHPPQTNDDAVLLVDDAIHQAIFACRCISHSALNNASPGAVVFHRDMFMDLPYTANLLTLQHLRQQKIDLRLVKKNAKRISKDWKIGDNIMLRQTLGSGDKLKNAFKGPFPIIQTHTNGTVTIQMNNGVQDRVSIRRLKPFKG